ncbi:hypothetical protein ACFL4G_09820 [Thermodesulfobacteriota bacterium]
MAIMGALEGFLDTGIHYLPLFNRFTGEHILVGGLQRIVYLLKGYLYLGGYGLLLVPAAWGVFITLFTSDADNARRRRVVLLCGLTFVYSLYPVLPGKFWGYHWLPFSYFVIMLAALCAAPPPAAAAGLRRVLPLIVMLVALVPFTGFQKELFCRISGSESYGARLDRVDKIAGYLEDHMQLGDAVQPLDGLGGAIHAMLNAKAKAATPFLYDFMFYHHVSSEYIQGLRARFLESFSAAAPRFVVEIYDESKPWPSGPDTTRDFRELRRILESEYSVAQSGDGYRILERNVEPGDRAEE